MNNRLTKQKPKYNCSFATCGQTMPNRTPKPTPVPPGYLQDAVLLHSQNCNSNRMSQGNFPSLVLVRKRNLSSTVRTLRAKKSVRH